jgi:hypothetical protein
MSASRSWADAAASKFVFDGLGLIPSPRDAKGVEAHVSLNYSGVLNIVFLVFATLLV